MAAENKQGNKRKQEKPAYSIDIQVIVHSSLAYEVPPLKI